MNRDEIQALVDATRADVEKLEQDMRMFQGKLRNLDPQRKAHLETENAALLKRQEQLQDSVARVTLLLSQPLPGAERDLEFESLRYAAVESLKKENVPPELWKNLESSL